ncbi:MAG: hypothetical protein A2Y40_07745 [Candidatus Margulisbacteria bacterium GWF2_35_9]|nr:MAG: hypothetical protein A2Y40_07745 [Candidatus Margulisbacteria bacterium GWF2_35_9]
MLLPNKKDSIHRLWLYRILTKIADDSYLASVLYFKGGTCAAIRNLLNRFSVDLDFDYMGTEHEIPKVKKLLETIFMDLGLMIKDQSSRVPQYFLKYSNNEGRNNLKIDTFFPPLLGNKYEQVRLVDIDRVLFCQTVETMFANKLIAFVDRYKKRGSIAARDLYDIHYFFLQGYEYDRNIIEKYSNQTIEGFLEGLFVFIESKISQTVIDQDLNYLLLPEEFKKIRTILKKETLLLIKNNLLTL